MAKKPTQINRQIHKQIMSYINMLDLITVTCECGNIRTTNKYNLQKAKTCPKCCKKISCLVHWQP